MWLSGLTGAGTELLRIAVGEHLDGSKLRLWLALAPAGGRLRAMLHEWGAVLDEQIREDGHWLLEITLSEARWQGFAREAEFDAVVERLEPESAAPAPGFTARSDPALN